jgi:hypothetical protein
LYITFNKKWVWLNSGHFFANSSGHPENRPNGHTIYQHLSLQDVTKFTQIGIFGLKTFQVVSALEANIFNRIERTRVRSPQNIPEFGFLV